MTKTYEVHGICRDHDRTEYVLQRNGDFEHPNQSDNALEFETMEKAELEASLYYEDDFSEIVAREIKIY